MFNVRPIEKLEPRLSYHQVNHAKLSDLHASPSPHPAARLSRRAFIAGFLALLLPIGLARAADPATQPAREIPIIRISGSAGEMGMSHGKQLREVIQLLHEKYLKVFLGSGTHRMFALGAARAFEQNLRPEHMAEIDALSVACGIDRDEAALGQCFLDLTAMQGCSTITLPAGAAPDHIARFGRNLDFPSLNLADRHSVLFVYRPGDGRYSFVSVGWPGMIGVLSGMNEHGLCLGNMEVARSPRLPQAMPYPLLYRTVLEHCRTVDEAIDLLSKTPRQTANNLMLMDAAGDRAVVEIRPEGIKVRRGERSAALISTNHQRDQDNDTPGRCKRYDFLHDAAQTQFGQIGEPALAAMLGGASQGDFTLQTMIFEPASRVLYLSTGKNAAKRPFTQIDVGALLTQ